MEREWWKFWKRYKKQDYNDLTIGDIETAVKGYFSNSNIDELKAKILSGYFYTIKQEGKQYVKGERNITLSTGSGGVLMYIDACVEKGIPSFAIEESIFVNVDGYSVCLKDISIKKNEQS